MTEPASGRSPLYEAHHAPRYERQALIRNYQETYSCRLVVMADYLFSHSVTLFEETLYDAKPDENLHVMPSTLGGDGETALRLVRQAQSRCKELTVIVPVEAKSAGTLFVLGADRIVMGPTSDLGPIDPQFRLPSGAFASGKAIIAAVEDAERRIQANPETYPLHASLLNDITALLVQQAKDAIARTGDQLKEALACVKGRDENQIDALASNLREPLIENPQSHGTAIAARHAKELELPVDEATGSEEHWRSIWRMWAKYAALNAAAIYEGQTASQVFSRPPPAMT